MYRYTATLFFFFTALILYMTRNDKLLHGNCIFGILNKKMPLPPPGCAALQNGFVVKNDGNHLSRPLSCPLARSAVWNFWNSSRHRGK